MSKRVGTKKKQEVDVQRFHPVGWHREACERREVPKEHLLTTLRRRYRRHCPRNFSFRLLQKKFVSRAQRQRVCADRHLHSIVFVPRCHHRVSPVTWSLSYASQWWRNEALPKEVPLLCCSHPKRYKISVEQISHVNSNTFNDSSHDEKLMTGQ